MLGEGQDVVETLLLLVQAAGKTVTHLAASPLSSLTPSLQQQPPSPGKLVVGSASISRSWPTVT